MDLVTMFESMNTVVLRELDTLKQREEEEGEQEEVDYGEVFTDFATPEFLDKNVRVRPVSGATHADETRDGRQSNISRGMGHSEVTPAWDSQSRAWMTVIMHSTREQPAILISREISSRLERQLTTSKRERESQPKRKPRKTGE